MVTKRRKDEYIHTMILFQWGQGMVMVQEQEAFSLNCSNGNLAYADVIWMDFLSSIIQKMKII